MGYTGQLDLMWLSLFREPVLAAVALITVFLILCYRRNLEPHHAFIVILPTIIGLMYDQSIPQYVRNFLLIGAGFVIGYGMIRLFKM